MTARTRTCASGIHKEWCRLIIHTHLILQEYEYAITWYERGVILPLIVSPTLAQISHHVVCMIVPVQFSSYTCVSAANGWDLSGRASTHLGILERKRLQANGTWHQPE